MISSRRAPRRAASTTCQSCQATTSLRHIALALSTRSVEITEHVDPALGPGGRTERLDEEAVA